MPRTKRPVARKEKVSALDDDSEKKLNKLVSDYKQKIDSLAQMEIRNIELAFKIFLTSLESSYLNKTIGELKRELAPKDAQSSRVTRHSARSASHDDGYLTENSSQGSGDRGKKRQIPVPKSTSRPTGGRSRSADASARKLPPTACKTVSRRRSKSVYRTPVYNRHAPVSYPDITPKVAPQTPLTVLRQPRQGEMVVSMSGSPVMVSNYNSLNQHDKANCNIMLEDGTMLSLQPKQLRQSQTYIPFNLMDEGVLAQLKTLKDNLDKVVRLGERAFK